MWLYKNEEIKEIPEGIIGFVYKITSLVDGRKYIGKKSYYFSKFKRIKGRKKRVKFESDWRSYWSSSEVVKSEVVRHGETLFIREVLHFCKSKMELNYLELREQIDRRVLETHEYFNEQIYCRIRKCPILIKIDQDQAAEKLAVKKEKQIK